MSFHAKLLMAYRATGHEHAQRAIAAMLIAGTTMTQQ